MESQEYFLTYCQYREESSPGNRAEILRLYRRSLGTFDPHQLATFLRDAQFPQLGPNRPFFLCLGNPRLSRDGSHYVVESAVESVAEMEKLPLKEQRRLVMGGALMSNGKPIPPQVIKRRATI